MSPRHFRQVNASDERLFTGRFFPDGGLSLNEDSHVGVLLLVPGAPESKAEVFSYLYRRLMSPPKCGISRFWRSHVAAWLRARIAARYLTWQYDAIGGGKAINQFHQEQANMLQSMIDRSDCGRTTVYVASPFGSPDIAAAAEKMEHDGVTHVVLLPLFPQYAAETTGRSFAEWELLMRQGFVSARPTVAVRQFATHEGYIEALNDRIDQGLQRFPRHVRSQVQLVFAAHGSTTRHRGGAPDPYCCLSHHTVDALMQRRGHDLPHMLAFVRPDSWGGNLAGGMAARFRELAATGQRAALVVPVDHVTEQFDTAYLLDVRMREVAEDVGLSHYEVVNGLNCHPLFMETLLDLVRAPLGYRSEPLEGLERFGSCPRPDWDVPPEGRCAVCPFGVHANGNDGNDGSGREAADAAAESGRMARENVRTQRRRAHSASGDGWKVGHAQPGKGQVSSPAPSDAK